MIYLTTLSIVETTASNGSMTVNDELDRLWKAGRMNVVPCLLPEGYE